MYVIISLLKIPTLLFPLLSFSHSSPFPQHKFNIKLSYTLAPDPQQPTPFSQKSVFLYVCIPVVCSQERQGSLDNLYASVVGESVFQSMTFKSMETLLTLFLVAWHILGSVWVLSLWRPPFKAPLHQPDVWCDQTLYMFTIAQIIGGYTLMFLWGLGIVCLVCAYRVTSNGGAAEN